MTCTDAFKVKGQVMIDFESYLEYAEDVDIGSLKYKGYGECRCEHCRENKGLKELYRTSYDDNWKEEQWENGQYLLCPPRVLGYILKNKQWAQLQVDKVVDIDITQDDGKDELWTKKLRLGDNNATKDLILNLVKGHSVDNTTDKEPLEVDDIIKNKGKGLVMLLYGMDI